MTYNFINEPDMAQTFVVACCFLGVHFKFTGLQSLKIKETDRITALIVELRKFGFIISTNNVDTMEWNGEKEEIKNSAISIATYHDHRMALAFAPATQVHGTFNIENPEVITKSYPFYWDDLKEAGFKVYSEQ